MAAVARTLGVTRQQVHRWGSDEAERVVSPSANRMADIAKATGVSGHWLLTGTGPMRPTIATPDEELAAAALMIRVACDRLLELLSLENRPAIADAVALLASEASALALDLVPDEPPDSAPTPT